MNLVLLTFGERPENHYQAMFAVLSFLKDPLLKRVAVVTDRPDFYALIAHKADIITIDQHLLTEWQGAQQFFWRVKIKALEMVQARYDGEHLLYIDSDTFLAGDLTALHAALERGGAVMHKRECVLADEPDKTLRKMHRTLRGKTFADIHVDGQSAMWNAGVIALPAARAEELIRLSLQVCDEICATDSPRRLAEQFAFSLALAHSAPLHPCDHNIGHYWGNKAEWNVRIADFFVHAMLKQLPLEQSIRLLATFDWRSIPLQKKQRSTNQKLKRLIDRFFKDKNILYFS